MDKINILISEEYSVSPFSEISKKYNLKYFNPNHDFSHTNDIHCLCIRSKTKITKESLSSFKNLKLIISATAGKEHVDFQACEDAGVDCQFVPEPSSESAAEHTIMLMLLLLRKYNESQEAIANFSWKGSYAKGHDLSSLTIGIVGYGRVGKKVTKALKSLGASVITYDPYVAEAGSDLGRLVDKSDIISFHVPATKETNKMANEDFFKKIKTGAYIINTSRGSVLCEEALVEALKSKRVAGAGLDVFESEPLVESSLLSKNKLSNLILTPHAGSWTMSSFEQASFRACAEIVSFF